MPTTILIGAVLVIAALYVVKTLTDRLVKRNVQRAGKTGEQNTAYRWQPDLGHHLHESRFDPHNGLQHAGVWLTEKSDEDRHEERREYLRERAKNDRHQDLD
ncbi:hypothetical protein G5V57_30765 [Nordella sp. HKS 07]|uniref:hypothetical protein n=1 Tax=Nordella sp. HKS 07 TaxID=2712222 RepID=UPI0013E17F48|nr:hypothetical protein [Nordella sp. HKS 07]QIG51713.1 hypothetical protein G5V57_30765 [Nordella sp. HKS 07]